MPSRLTGIANQYNPTLRVGLYSLVNLGPEGWEKGGYIVRAGTPEEIANVKESHTSQFLKKISFRYIDLLKNRFRTPMRHDDVRSRSLEQKT